MNQITICERCNNPCNVNVVYWEEKHGWSFGPYEKCSELVSDCCGAACYVVDAEEEK